MKEKIRIIHVVDTLSIGSGVMNFIMNYYRNINRDAFQFDFLYLIDSDNTFKEEITDLGGCFHYVKIPKLRNILSFKNKINDFFRENFLKFDAIHLHQLNIGFIIFPIAKKYGISTLIMHAHATKYSDKQINALRNYLLVYLAKKQATVLLACSKAAGSYIFRKDAINNKVKIINNAIDYDKYKYNEETRLKIRKQLGFENKLIIGHIGRFEEPKNHKFIVEIYSKIKIIEPASKLVLVGSGSLQNNIESQVDKLGLIDDVVFIGLRNDVSEILQGIDIFVLPSLFEGFGMVLIEAQVAGVPCVVSDSVSNETKISDLINYVSLHESAEFWARKILNDYENYVRNYNMCFECDNKFNIRNEAKNLEGIYFKYVNKK